ncbi:MAG: glycosyl hydrolase family 92 [Crocinitomicaceae bacterium]|nr:glycosyl hydrolase family 92 [Crocinitomicaceae bacterium]
MKNVYIIIFSLFISSCSDTLEDYSNYINPFIGTGAHGHTFPGPTMPFGMVQLSPDTRIEGWDGCSGYHYSDSIIYGFTHTHLSGTGIGDYCDLLLMPTMGDICFNNGYLNDSFNNYSSTFKKVNEFASAGYYEVLLDKYDIKCKLTSTDRVGIHEYTYNNKKLIPSIVLDLEHRDILLDWSLDIRNSNEISGKRISKSWADEQHFYFYMEFSENFESFTNKDTNSSKVFLKFNNLKDDKLMVKVGISMVSEENAKENLNTEAKDWNFHNYKTNSKNNWNQQLQKIKISTDKDSLKEIFYTAMYHTMIAPNIISDVNGDFRSTDMKVHRDSLINFTVFSLWDTFRSTHPLFNLIERNKTALFLNTFLNQYNYGGQLPIWELCANYTGCMIGYHVVSVILDAYVKGIKYPKYIDLLGAMKHVSNRETLGIPEFKNRGYISSFEEPESVSKTLEYSYNDWCIYKMAEYLNDSNFATQYIDRSQSYKNLFNKNTGLMQPKTNGNWKFGFIPSEVNYNYTEANSWQYSFFVPHDMKGLINLHGGEQLFQEKLDELFTVNSTLEGRNQADITGLIGQYAHGNEPSHYMAYLYNMAGNPKKSQKMVNNILNQMYSTQPTGIIGNEDCGQMSAWYVLSSMGLFDVNPGDPFYIIQTPLFKDITINLENGNNFRIVTNTNDSEFIYIKSVILNGEKLNRNYLHISEILNGGIMLINKTKNYNDKWKCDEFYNTEINENLHILKIPRIIANSKTFKDSIEIKIEGKNNETLFYKKSSDLDFKEFKSSFYLDETDTVYCYSQSGNKTSKVESACFLKFNQERTIHLKSPYSNQYDAGGDNALVDGLKGPNNYLTGRWQGFYGEDFESTVDLGEIEDIRYLNIGAIQDVRSWIWLPKEVVFLGSLDGLKFKKICSLNHSIADNTSESVIKQFEQKLINPFKARFVKVKAKNYGLCPTWHLGSGGTSWLFFDEITIY